MEVLHDLHLEIFLFTPSGFYCDSAAPDSSSASFIMGPDVHGSYGFCQWEEIHLAPYH